MKEYKEEKKEKNRLFLLLLLMLGTLLLFSASSYAWFSANRMVTIDSLDIKVATVGGIDISADALNWKASITTSELIEVKDTTYQTSTNQIPLYIEPVSTGGFIDENGFLKLYHGIATNDDINGNFLLTTTRSIEEFGYGVLSSGKFIVFDIFLRTTSPQNLYLTTDSGVNFNGEKTVGIENAFRIAFLNEGNVPKETNYLISQALKNATKPYIWEPNYDTHTDGGVSNALNTYGIVTTKENGEKLNYDGVTDEITREDNISLSEATEEKNSTKFKRVDIDYATKTNRDSYEKIFDLPSGISKIRIYIWIEGQDVDCENEASVGDAKLTLKLSTNPA